MSTSNDFSEKNLIKTMYAVELLYWDYLDNYHKVDKIKYPYLNQYEFLTNYVSNIGLSGNVRYYWRQYEKYKKTIPTAGCILHNNGRIIVVKVYNSKIFSMPKGKKDSLDNDLIDTAIREVREETGIQVSRDILTPYNEIVILRTTFYVVEIDGNISTFSDYNNNEIIDIQWVHINDILANSYDYSKQTYLVAEYLFNGKILG